MDNFNQTEGPRVQIINNDGIRSLYSSFDLISLGFALFLIFFGVVGYIEAKSIISLIASAGISIPILIASYLATKHIYWSFLALFAALLLFIMMSIRFYKSAKFYPAGMVSLTSFVYLIYLITRLVLFFKNNR